MYDRKHSLLAPRTPAAALCSTAPRRPGGELQAGGRTALCCLIEKKCYDLMIFFKSGEKTSCLIHSILSNFLKFPQIVYLNIFICVFYFITTKHFILHRSTSVVRDVLFYCCCCILNRVLYCFLLPLYLP